MRSFSQWFAKILTPLSVGLATMSVFPSDALATVPLSCEMIFATANSQVTTISDETLKELAKMYLEIQETQAPPLKKLFSDWLSHHTTDALSKNQLLKLIEEKALALKQMTTPQQAPESKEKTLRKQERALFGFLPGLHPWMNLNLSPELLVPHQENQLPSLVFEKGLGQFHNLTLQWGVDAIALLRDKKNVAVFNLKTPNSPPFNLKLGVLSSVAPVYAEVQESRTHTQLTNLATGRASSLIPGLPFELFPELVNTNSVILRTGRAKTPTATWYSQAGQPRPLGANFGFESATGRVVHFDEMGALRIFDIQTGTDLDLAQIFPLALSGKFHALPSHFVLKDIFLVRDSHDHFFALNLKTFQLNPIMPIPDNATIFAMGPGRYLVHEAPEGALSGNPSHQFLAADPESQNFFPISSQQFPQFSNHSDWVTSVFADTTVVAENFRTGEHIEVPRSINSGSFSLSGDKIISSERLNMFVFDLVEKRLDTEVNLGDAHILPGTHIWLQGFTNFLALPGTQSMMNQMLRNQGLKPRFSAPTTTIPYGQWGLRLKKGDQWQEMTVSEDPTPPHFSSDLKYLVTTEGKSLVIKKANWD